MTKYCHGWGGFNLDISCFCVKDIFALNFLFFALFLPIVITLVSFHLGLISLPSLVYFSVLCVFPSLFACCTLCRSLFSLSYSLWNFGIFLPEALLFLWDFFPMPLLMHLPSWTALLVLTLACLTICKSFVFEYY